MLGNLFVKKRIIICCSILLSLTILFSIVFWNDLLIWFWVREAYEYDCTPVHSLEMLSKRGEKGAQALLKIIRDKDFFNEETRLMAFGYLGYAGYYSKRIDPSIILALLDIMFDRKESLKIRWDCFTTLGLCNEKIFIDITISFLRSMDDIEKINIEDIERSYHFLIFTDFSGKEKFFKHMKSKDKEIYRKFCLLVKRVHDHRIKKRENEIATIDGFDSIPPPVPDLPDFAIIKD